VQMVSGGGDIGLGSWVENAAHRTSCDRDRDRRASARVKVCKYRLMMQALHQSDTRS